MGKSRDHLEFEKNETFQKMEWRVQRFGWVVWALLLLAAMLGLMGSGWFSDAAVTSADGSITVEYKRFLHYHKPSQLQVLVHAAAGPERQWHVKVDRSLLDQFQILRIDPEPVRHEIENDGIVYSFLSASPSTQGKIVFHIEFEHYGKTQGNVSLVGSDPVTLSQFIYP
jgi:hypothetical protein